MKLIPVTPSDAEQYAELRNGENTYKWFFSGVKHPPEEVRRWLTQSISEGELNFFGYDDDALVGAVSLYKIDNTVLLNAEVGRVIVAEDQRGKGYGTKLLQAIVEKAKEIGLDDVFAFVMRDNIPSQKAFEAVLFKDSGSYEDKCEYFRPVVIE